MKILALVTLVLGACGSTAKDPAALNGCSTYADHSSPGDSREVDFGTPTIGTNYSPKCMQIAVGQTVKFVGDFADHPLSPGSSPSETTAGSANNPITTPAVTATESDVTFPTAGAYPYYCANHYSAGMVGVIKVQ